MSIEMGRYLVRSMKYALGDENVDVLCVAE